MGAATPAAPPLLHPRQVESVLALHKEWARQRDEGVCDVERFDDLLALKFPREGRARRRAMGRLIKAREAERAARELKRRMAELELQSLFGALDTDSHGTVELHEFVQLTKVTGIPKERLAELFREKDVDGSGSLDHDEFRALMQEHALGACLSGAKEAILAQGAALKEQHKIDEAAKHDPVWKLTMIPLDQTALRPGERPSLHRVSSAILQMQRAANAMRPTSAAAALAADPTEDAAPWVRPALAAHAYAPPAPPARAHPAASSGGAPGFWDDVD